MLFFFLPSFLPSCQVPLSLLPSLLMAGGLTKMIFYFLLLECFFCTSLLPSFAPAWSLFPSFLPSLLMSGGLTKSKNCFLFLLGCFSCCSGSFPPSFPPASSFFTSFLPSWWLWGSLKVFFFVRPCLIFLFFFLPSFPPSFQFHDTMKNTPAKEKISGG